MLFLSFYHPLAQIFPSIRNVMLFCYCYADGFFSTFFPSFVSLALCNKITVICNRSVLILVCCGRVRRTQENFNRTTVLRRQPNNENKWKNSEFINLYQHTLKLPFTCSEQWFISFLAINFCRFSSLLLFFILYY